MLELSIILVESMAGWVVSFIIVVESVILTVLSVLVVVEEELDPQAVAKKRMAADEQRMIIRFIISVLKVIDDYCCFKIYWVISITPTSVIWPFTTVIPSFTAFRYGGCPSTIRV